MEKLAHRTDKRLGKIEKLLTNHVAHQKLMIEKWIKIVLPLLAVIIPVLVALAEKLPEVLALFVKHKVH